MNALRRHSTRALIGLAAVGLIAGCTETATPDTEVAPPRSAARPVAALTEIDRCDQLVDITKDRLEQVVEAQWWEPPAPSTVEQIFGRLGSWLGGEGTETGDAALDAAPAPMTSLAAPSDVTRSASEAGSVADESSAGGAASVIGTNNQEASVDEADLVKTDGHRIVTIVDGVLRVTIADSEPAVDGAIDLTGRGATEMFLRGDSVLVVGSTYGGGRIDEPMPMPGPAPRPMPMPEPVPEPTLPPSPVPAVPPTEPPTGPPTTLAPSPPTGAETDTTQGSNGPLDFESVPPSPPVLPEPPATEPAPFLQSTTLTLVSIQDPTRPEVVASTDVEGNYVAARSIDGTARIVVQSSPYRLTDQVFAATDKAAALAAVDQVTAEDVLPLQASDGEVQAVGDCSDVLVMPDPDSEAGSVGTPIDGAGATSSNGLASDAMYAPSGGLDTVTVLTVGTTLDDLAPTTIQGSSETVYASADALYLASGAWTDTGPLTAIHRFDLTGDGPAAHSGSGIAPGRLLNQFSLSDRAGTLRVVTTIEGPAATSGRLTNLDTDGTLDEIGHLDGMGIGEEVKSVRFLDDLGYVVTFRQTDPLYALDLSDPRNPRQLGELKIPGFSEYLHPIGDGLLLGIGSDADPTTGRTTGAKVSLFDVSDPAAMVEVDQVILPDGWSPVAQDHKAFLWDPARRQAVIPLNGSAGGAAAVFRVEGRALRNTAQIQHPGSQWNTAPFRSLVIDDGLWTLSDSGLGRSDADDPASVEFAPFVIAGG